MFGIDISNYQKNLDLSTFDFDFAIIKATEGKSSISQSFEKQVKWCKDNGKLIGCYHYARPDLNRTIFEMENEADHFVSTVEKYLGEREAILVLDWEQNPTNEYILCKAFLDRVKYLTGVEPFVYASKSVIMGNIAFFNNYPIWIAAWPTNYPVKWHADIDWINTYSTKLIPWKIWQYTSSGKVDGYYGDIDFDYTNMTRDGWLIYAGKKEIPVVENITDDMGWAIENGIFEGYPDGAFKPGEPLTRQAAATILRRFYNIIMN